jgi:hypothetical protein
MSREQQGDMARENHCELYEVGVDPLPAHLPDPRTLSSEQREQPFVLVLPNGEVRSVTWINGQLSLGSIGQVVRL